jgi:ATP-binding cassette subfamily F protein 3
VVADHAVASFDGDLDDYRREVLSARSRPEPARENNERVTVRPREERTRGERQKPLKQKISEAEAEIERITAIIAKIDTALALPDIFTRDPKQAAQLSQARANAADALQRAEEQWLEASAQNEETAG